MGEINVYELMVPRTPDTYLRVSWLQLFLGIFGCIFRLINKDESFQLNYNIKYRGYFI